MTDVWPFRPLRDLLVDGTGSVPDADLAALLRCDRRTLHVWRCVGVPTFEADRLACQVARRHPVEVWPDWFTEPDSDGW